MGVSPPSPTSVAAYQAERADPIHGQVEAHPQRLDHHQDVLQRLSEPQKKKREGGHDLLTVPHLPLVVAAHLSSTSLTILRWLLLSHCTPPTTSTVMWEFTRGCDLFWGGNGSVQQEASHGSFRSPLPVTCGAAAAAPA